MSKFISVSGGGGGPVTDEPNILVIKPNNDNKWPDTKGDAINIKDFLWDNLPSGTLRELRHLLNDAYATSVK